MSFFEVFKQNEFSRKNIFALKIPGADKIFSFGNLEKFIFLINLYFSCGFHLVISFDEVFKHKSQRKIDFKEKILALALTQNIPSPTIITCYHRRKNGA
jgi:hypothetical protein